MYNAVFKLPITLGIILIETEGLYGLYVGVKHESILSETREKQV